MQAKAKDEKNERMKKNCANECTRLLKNNLARKSRVNDAILNINHILLSRLSAASLYSTLSRLPIEDSLLSLNERILMSATANC